MLNPANDLLPPPSSPTNSSISSSDLDTESTGSFFHDRSTTLGTLMGVSFPAMAFRAQSQRRREAPTSIAVATQSSAVAVAVAVGRAGSRKYKKAKKNKKAAMAVAVERRRRWWSLCRDDGNAKPASLGEFLEVERRCGDGAFFGAAAEFERAVVEEQKNGRVLFADGRVLPPAVDVDETMPSSGWALCRFPVPLTGICSGCVG